MVTIDADRFEKTFRRYSQIGRTDDDGLHRLTLTETDRNVRDLFVEDLESLGLDIRIDEIGNIFGRRPGTDPDAAPADRDHILTHSRTAVGSTDSSEYSPALETLRTFEDAGVDHRRPIEIVNWTNEEGSRFKPALMGSGTFIGEFDVTDTLKHTDADGVTVAEALEQIGYNGEEPCEPREPYDSYLELHIEQGPKLEEAGLAVGAVEGVFGMAWLEATIHGDADHSVRHRCIPVETRSSPRLISSLRFAASQTASHDVVTTVGELEVSPGSINVVPAEARLTIDVRSYDDDAVAELVDRVEEIEAACNRENVSYDLEEILWIPHRVLAAGEPDGAGRRRSGRSRSSGQRLAVLATTRRISTRSRTQR